MWIDAQSLPAGTALRGDVCVIGAGPAGLTLATALAERGVDVLLLESGGVRVEGDVQTLNEGAVVGDAYAGLRQTRARALGGTAHLWNTLVDGEAGAKYAPLDAIDFDIDPRRPLSGWPLRCDNLDAYYERARNVCSLGRWPATSVPQPELCNGIENRVYQLGSAKPFTERLPKQLLRASNARMLTHATVCRLELSTSRTRVTEASVFSPHGRATISAGTFVLAAGAIENARLLLLSAPHEGVAPGNHSGWVGRCFMEHPRDSAMTLLVATSVNVDSLSFYDVHAGLDDGIVCGYIALQSHAVRELGAGNAWITLLPLHTGRYGWASRGKGRGRTDAFRLVVNLEQQPQSDNRITLASGATDDYGLARAELHWRWRPGEQTALETLREYVARRFRESGLGIVAYEPGVAPDPNAHHHAGTTRMHADPDHGVVDPDARVYGVENLYVAGASVFPTAGVANPTLTIVAMALRLADHLDGTGGTERM